VALLRRLRRFFAQRTVVLVLPGLLAVAFAAGRAASALVLLALAPPRELVLEPGDDGTVRVGWTAYRDAGDAELDALFGARRGHVELR
jgi:hypothetical protein